MNVKFKWIGGATFILSINNLRIAIDPVLCKQGTVQDFFWFKSKRTEQPIYNKNDFENIDLWLITHNHDDHLDDIGISKISKLSNAVCNKNSFKKLKKRGIENLTVLKRNETKNYKLKNYEIKIEAVTAIHGINPVSALLAGKGNGYYLIISNKQEKVRIYITGDTVYKSKIIKRFRDRKIDLLIPNMGAAKKGSWIMTLTLNSEMLKKMIYKLNPKIIIPVHYGTFEHYKEPVEVIKNIRDKRIKIVEIGCEKTFIFDNILFTR